LGGGWWNRTGPAYQAKKIASSQEAKDEGLSKTAINLIPASNLTSTTTTSAIASADEPNLNTKQIVK